MYISLRGAITKKKNGKIWEKLNKLALLQTVQIGQANS